jgi:hypothetical protein
LQNIRVRHLHNHSIHNPIRLNTNNTGQFRQISQQIILNIYKGKKERKTDKERGKERKREKISERKRGKRGEKRK